MDGTRLFPRAPAMPRLAPCLLLVASFVPAARAEPNAEGIEFFESRIRPVLVERCYSCHNSADTAEGGLAVDHRAAFLKGGEGGPVVVPGDVKRSRLPAILRHEVDGMEMPQDGPKLAKSVVADFEKWIAMGAPDPRDQPPSADEIARSTSWEAIRERRKQWWSFQPIRDPEPPVGRASQPIDRFLEARLRDAGLEPNATADPATLVRRAYLVLVGLPPTLDEATRWTKRLSANDPTERETAYGELIDELLASPHFGERWARHWMDWIRYAESHGSEGDPNIEGAWRYRDYLIRALNADVPYDQLLREHVAGDLLPEPRINDELGIDESVIGTAHWRMVFHGFAPTDALDERVRFTDDQINAFSKAFLGLTVSCARCHDHKFDAISQKDYYALFGILRSCRPGREAIETPERLRTNHDELSDLKPRIRAALADAWLESLPNLRTRLLDPNGPAKNAKEPRFLLYPLQRQREEGGEFAAAWQRRVAEWRADRDARTADEKKGTKVRWQLGDADDHATFTRSGLGLPAAPHPAGTFAVAPDGQNALLGIYPAGVYSHAVSTKHAARLASADVTLDGKYDVWIRAVGQQGATVRYAVWDYPRRGTVYPVAGLGPWKWQRFDLKYWIGDDVHVELTTAGDAPLLTGGQPRSWFGVREIVVRPHGGPAPPEGREQHDPVFGVFADRPPTTFEELADGYVTAIETSLRAWRKGEAADVEALLLGAAIEQGVLTNRVADLPTVQPLVAEYRRLEAAIPVPTRVPALQETPGRDQPLFVRGNHEKPAEVVPRRFLEAIDDTPYDTEGSGRLRLAEDLLRDDNPLVRRVIVNRLWHHLFGEGIVRTPDNLGRLGTEPTHPELLDWLATRFVHDGWSLKKAIRQIVMSDSWRRSALPSERATEVDPDNWLLSHAHTRRLEAEAIRDAMLAASGVLDRATFGSPVDGNANRRSVYVRVRRNALDPFLRAFDFPEPFSSVGRRDVTNVPAQSLVWMNDPRVDGVAGSWARRVLADDSLPDDAARVRAMFLAAFGRRASDAEVDRVRMFLHGTDRAHEEAIARANELRRTRDEHRRAVAAILDPVRARLLADRKRETGPAEKPPQPFARWDFDGNANDAIGNAHATLHGGARIEDGALVVDGRGAYALTKPLDRDLKAKTLEAWVRLDDLNQRGGGAVSVMTPDGVTFDAIVFGEQNPGQWMAGSNFFRRTKSFDAPAETEAAKRTVHVAIVYRADGTIACFRDGRAYGTPYKVSLQPFAKGATVVAFGLRHLAANAGRCLAAKIDRAQLHERALSEEEIRNSAGAVYVTNEEVLAALTPERRREHDRHAAEAARLDRELAALGPVPERLDDAARWKQLALAILAMKEFVYLR